MRQFHEKYRHHEKVSPLVTQLRWTHHPISLSQTRRPEEREFYVLAVVIGLVQGGVLMTFADRTCGMTARYVSGKPTLATVQLDTHFVETGKIGEAIKVALRGFPTGGGAKLIVLITDGDDQDPYSEEAAKAARDAGVKIIAVGLGSETGSQITLTDPQTGAKTTLMHDKVPVISKLNGDQLRKIALVTEGAYVPAGTSAIDLDSIMESHVQPIVRAAADASIRRIPSEQFQWLVLISLLCLLGALWVGAGAGDLKTS